MALAMALGGWFMQQAYAAGPPQLAVASVTIVDPIVAVLIGAVLLGEAAGLPWWIAAAELAAAAVAIGGVVALAGAQVRLRAGAAPDAAWEPDLLPFSLHTSPPCPTAGTASAP